MGNADSRPSTIVGCNLRCHHCIRAQEEFSAIQAFIREEEQHDIVIRSIEMDFSTESSV